MNIGIQDACSLAHALSRGEAALADWAATRRAVAATVLRRADLLTGMVIGRGPAIRALRAVALRALPHLRPMSRRMEGALAGMDYPSATG
jgi:2-polyprenyl-6-methoxyphenol hydroxylase-like FAD-dependent oxidoreductase